VPKPAPLHNTPSKILIAKEELEQKIAKAKAKAAKTPDEARRKQILDAVAVLELELQKMP
jgi:sRNA-binding carbon storage regulator CsrA